MASKFFVPGSDRAPKVGDLFAAIAPRYDVINDLQSFGMHRLWKQQMVAAAALQPGKHALDVCCGTGDVTFRLARTGADTVGFDFSHPCSQSPQSGRPRIHCPPVQARFVFNKETPSSSPFPTDLSTW